MNGVPSGEGPHQPLQIPSEAADAYSLNSPISSTAAQPLVTQLHHRIFEEPSTACSKFVQVKPMRKLSRLNDRKSLHIH